MFFKDEETRIQVAVANYLKYKWPDVLFTIAPSGNKLAYKKGAQFKAMGYKAGTPDLMVFEPRQQFFQSFPSCSGPGEMRIWHGLFLELKTENGKLQDSQKDFIKALDARNYVAQVCYGYNKAIAALEGYLELPLVKS